MGKKAPAFPFDELIEGIGTKFPDEFRILLPLPPVELSPNRNFHFNHVAAVRREYRQECAWLTASAIRAAGVKFRFLVMSSRYVIIDGCPVANEKKMLGGKLIPVKYRPQDSQNAMSALKAAQDGMVDAGLCDNDSRHYVMQGLVVIERMSRNHATARGYPTSCVEMIIQGVLDN